MSPVVEIDEWREASGPPSGCTGWRPERADRPYGRPCASARRGSGTDLRLSRDPRPAGEHGGMKTSSARPRPRRLGRSEPLKWRVSDAMWERLAPILTDPPRRFRYPGRARYGPRQCLEGILYVLYTDTPWLQVPYRELGLPSGETCRRRLEEWSRRGLFQQAIRVLHEQLAEADRLDWSRVIVDASLVEAKKGARRSRARSAAAPAAAST